jgi:hypothetical protein
MVEPPDLQAPFRNDTERSLELAALLKSSVALERWLQLSADPMSIPGDLRGLLEDSIQGGDTVELRLRRWANVYSEELRAVLDARNRAVHGIRLTDTELRGAAWLARYLLGLLEPQNAA